MSTALEFDIELVARELKLDAKKVTAAIDLLNDGNTIPFITRYRKDATGGLDETQIRAIKDLVAQQKAILERRSFILKSIESQGNLTPERKEQIERARTIKHLEDLYLPFKPKKQTLATVARQKGLEPLANDIFDGREPDIDLATRATEFVRVDKNLHSVDEVIQGVGHILAERFSERADLRFRLRKSLWQKGRIVTHGIQADSEDGDDATETTVSNTAVSNAADANAAEASQSPAANTQSSNQVTESVPASTESGTAAVIELAAVDSAVISEPAAVDMPGPDLTEDQTPDGQENNPSSPENGASNSDASAAPATAEIPTENVVNNDIKSEENSGPTNEAGSAGDAADQSVVNSSQSPGVVEPDENTTTTSVTSNLSQSTKLADSAKKKKKKKKKKASNENPYQDYQNYSEKLDKIPPHRILAINRGERAKMLRVRIEGDDAEMQAIAEKKVVPDGHPFAEFLKACVKDSLNRLIIPSLEREIRRELTERAESHAVEVFARNLRSLLLQPPVNGRRVLAVDPGFRSGCKLAVIDQYGKFLVGNVLHLVGNEEKRKSTRQWLVDAVKEHDVSVIAIGNGTACRQTEQLISDILANELSQSPVKYVIVNEAGASVYSTSDVGREELPDHDPVIRSAISIGRRLLDPLSELVKINPANIGVGLYQHDVKAKHLGDSLDEVVESCVNFVGVDVNTASPALLRHVAGLNQLTARRMFEYRQEHGPFLSREHFKNVSGFGDATFLQAAGFLRIPKSDNPLDATSIHPESYALAERILNKFDADPQSLGKRAGSPPEAETTADGATVNATGKPEDAQQLREKLKSVDVSALADEFGVGRHLIRDILNSMIRPGRDPREDLPAPIFRTGILKFEDLKPEMQLKARVLNVVDFGVFVDIGVGESSMIHVSRLAAKFVNDPHQLFAVGDTLDVWVIDIDKERRRVNLTAIKPGTEKQNVRHFAAAKRHSKDTDSAAPKPHTPDRSTNRKFKKHPAKKGQTNRKNFRHERPAKPKQPSKPITKEMIEGKEPMRTFGDLAQLFDLDKKSKNKKENDS
jgi:protein Tex